MIAIRLAALVGLLVCSAAVTAAESSWQGVYSGQGRPLVEIARDEESWRRLWSHLNTSPPQPLPPDRFGAAVFIGVRPTGGYAVEILDVEEGPCLATIRYAERAPSPNAIVTQAITTPFAIRLIPRVERPIEFERAGDGARSLPFDEEARVRRARAACAEKDRAP